jgi:hypothetical protein
VAWEKQIPPAKDACGMTIFLLIAKFETARYRYQGKSTSKTPASKAKAGGHYTFKGNVNGAERAAAISVSARKSEERSFAALRMTARDADRRSAAILGR